MKASRLIVFLVALGAGIAAAFLIFQFVSKPAEQAPAPVMAEAPPPDTVDVLVAATEIPAGKRLQAGDLSWQAFPKAGIVEFYITKDMRAGAVDEFSGSVARVPMLPGEPVREQRLMKADRGFMSVILTPGMRASAIEVKLSSTAGGFVLPNDHVDVLLTRASPKGQSADPYVAETLLTDIRVLAVDQAITDVKGEAAMVARNTVTLELTPRQTEIVALAQQLGVLSLVLRPVGDTSVPVADDQAGGAVKVVRYGVTSSVSIRR